ncbi:non-canonical purine NTP pyrophosphatase [Pantoea agglomerans]|uniref:non-canonical purine NTP pyrophosphatase n=1 Tax=Pantoea TaxID=53335 RepID=UPI00351D979F
MINDFILGKDTNKYSIERISKKFILSYGNAILELLNEIRGISLDKAYLEDTHCLYKWRDELSYFCFDGDKLIAIIFSYYKKSDTHTPFDSVYIHRLVVHPAYRNIGIAQNLLRYCIDRYYDDLPWLQNISIQVTILPKNDAAAMVYKKVGFTSFGQKKYPNKTDDLLLLQRKDKCLIKKDNPAFFNPRIPVDNDDLNRAMFYFSTSSEEKRKQFSWLFSLYNLKLDFYNISNHLVEPQIEDATVESEKKLVSHPIKHASRFIKKKPFIVEDTMLFIERFNKNYDTNPELPGLDTKRWWKQLGNEGVLDLLSNSKMRKAKYVSQIGCFIDAQKYYYGRGELNGTIAQIPMTSEKAESNFPKTNPYFFHQIFIPDGYNEPLSMLSAAEFTMVDYRRKALEDLLENLVKIKSDDDQLRLL